MYVVDHQQVLLNPNNTNYYKWWIWWFCVKLLDIQLNNEICYLFQWYNNFWKNFIKLQFSLRWMRNWAIIRSICSMKIFEKHHCEFLIDSRNKVIHEKYLYRVLKILSKHKLYFNFEKSHKWVVMRGG